jgi:hypothetical protein
MGVNDDQLRLLPHRHRRHVFDRRRHGQLASGATWRPELRHQHRLVGAVLRHGVPGQGLRRRNAPNCAGDLRESDGGCCARDCQRVHWGAAGANEHVRCPTQGADRGTYHGRGDRAGGGASSGGRSQRRGDGKRAGDQDSGEGEAIGKNRLIQRQTLHLRSAWMNLKADVVAPRHGSVHSGRNLVFARKDVAIAHVYQ